MIVISTINRNNSIITTVKSFIVLARVKHWLKNVLIFVPIVYGRSFFEPALLLPTTLAFVAFCLVSSGIYAFNDIVDVEKDRRHPVKKKRPIASGIITIKQAIVYATALFITGISLSIVGQSNYLVLFFVAIYMLVNIAYSLKLKHHALVDCFCIASGFVLRVLVGGATYGEGISDWLFLTVVAMSLFMAFGKRRGEINKVADANETRKALASYNVGFLNGMMFTCAGLAIVFYSLWAMLIVSTMIYTVPLVIFIVCKYLLILHDGNSHGDPTSVILGDRLLIATVLLFGIISVVLLYWGDAWV